MIQETATVNTILCLGLTPWLSGIKDAVITVVAIIGAYAAISGLKTWRRQLRGNTEYELAKRLLKTVYHVRDQIKYIRTPFISAGEISRALDEEAIEIDQNDPLQNRIKTRAVYNMRWNRLLEASSEMHIELLESEVIWGRKAKQLVTDLENHIKKLYIALITHFQVLEGKIKPTEEKIRQNDEIIYDTGGDKKDNEFSNGIRKAVERIEEFIKPRLRL